MRTKTLGVKEYNESDFTDIAHLLWTNIGLKTSLNPIQNLLLANVAGDSTTSIFNTYLARQVFRTKKNVLLVDLDRRSNNFKRHTQSAIGKPLPAETPAGITDFCYKLYEEPFFSTNVSDYGFLDLMLLFFFKARTGHLVLVSDEEDPVHMELQNGYPVEVMTSLGSLRVGDSCPDLYDSLLAKEFSRLAEKSFLSFNFTETQIDNKKHTHKIPFTPIFLNNPLNKNDAIISVLNHYCSSVETGLYFLPLGQFRLKGTGFAKKFQRILPVLRQKFDFILVNSPAFSDNPISREMGKVLDGTVLVVTSGAIERKHFKGLLSDLKHDHVNVIGTILNESETNS